MSHRPERKEKDCLNCGSNVQGKFCHICGQENVEPKETFFGMATHFFNDITHFDGKFFTTLKDLVTLPGFLSAEYMRGRRMSYLNPVRMYLFTSAIFFLIFFAINDPKDAFKITEGDEPMSVGARDSVVQLIEKKLKKDPGNDNLIKQLSLLTDTTIEVTPLDMLPFTDDFKIVGTIGGDYKSKSEYDSLQSILPPGKRDGWLSGLWNKKAIYLNEKFKYNQAVSLEIISDSLLHRLPYLLFVSLPFFALILRLLYVRKRKQFYYTDHAIFSVHHYIISFILLLFILLWSKMSHITGWGVWNLLMFVTILAWPVYLYLAMKRFYGQGHGKTVIKFLLLNITAYFLLIILMLFFLLFSFFQL
ncbi:MAG: DUF3667 domain-containing protein [Bacteroidetes bacterium]|nr:MAG: DUF3667 domain-containing protein [Bacteroidota bacterium]